MATVYATPSWTAPMLPASGGEDHLGLASVSSAQILPMLSPTINVLTPHPRYHSFYAFLLDEFWQRDLPRSHRAWVRFFRPRDFAYSVAMHLCDRPEHNIKRGITGSRKTEPLAKGSAEAFDTTTEYIKERLGGYGLYYRSVLGGLGLLYPGGPGLPYPVDVPTETGKQLAAAFRSAIEDTDYYRHHFDHDEALVPRAALEQFAGRACLCQLRTPNAPDGEILRRRFLEEPHSVATARRLTFAFLLDLARQTDGFALHQDAFRDLVYFGASTEGAAYAPGLGLELTHRKWRLYQAREYYTFALTGLWIDLCDWGIASGGDLRPIALSDTREHVARSCDFDALAASFDLPAPGVSAADRFQTLLDWLAGGDREGFDRRCGLEAPLNERRLMRLAQHPGDATARVAGGIAMLAALFLRFGDAQTALDPAWAAVSRKGSDGRLSIHGFMVELRRRLSVGDPTVGDVACWLLDDYVILQHQLIATGKLPYNTFRFEREGNRLRFHRHSNPLEFSDSRYEALSTTVHELGFCASLATTDHTLSADGRRLLDG